MSGRAGTCPSCGAPLTFEVGSSHSAVCRFCNALVARQGQGFELIGKVADLIPTGTRIALGARGKHVGQPFTVVGRLQLSWAGGVWDEWYVSFAGGEERWGWLAEAQNRYYLTFPMPTQNLPPAAALVPGRSFDIAPHGHFVVTDIKDATVASASGELPEAVSLTGASHSADLQGSQGIFATLDYGDVPGEAHPTLFVGVQVTLASLELEGGVASFEPAPEAEALLCKNCGAPVSVRVPGQTSRVTCASCNALLDLDNGSLRLIHVLERHREEPPVPLGTMGVLRGKDVVVVGWMVRGCDVSGTHYTWDELLLYEPKSTELSWLVRNASKWSSARSISAADVEEVGTAAVYRGKRYRRFSMVTGKVERVLGEFPWRVEVGEHAELTDYVAAPDGVSVETSREEINWSFVEHVEAAEVATAFNVPALARVPFNAPPGAVEPWFLEGAIPAFRRWLTGGVAAAFLLLFFFMARGSHVVATHMFTLADLSDDGGGPGPPPNPPSDDGGGPGPPPNPPDAGPGASATPAAASAKPASSSSPTSAQAAAADTRVCSYLSPPFELQGRRAVEVSIGTSVQNAWAYVETGLISEDSGDVSLVGLEASYYFGSEGGEDWSEGSKSASAALSAPRRGTYLVRADLQWDPKLPAPPSVLLEVREGGWSGGQFFALLMALCSPLLLYFQRQAFEKKKWEESNLG